MSPAQRGATYEPRPDREPESASFQTARVGGGRGRPPAFVFVFVAILAAVVAAGVGGQTPPAPTDAPVVAAASPSASPSETAPVPVFPAPTPGEAPDTPTVGTFGGPIELTIRRQTASIFVHGDVFVPKVTWVYISLQDARGQIAGWASVSVPGGAGPAASDGPSLRFDVDVNVRPDLSEVTLWIQATAYDASGEVIGAARVGVRPDGGPMDGPPGFGGFGGFRPVRVDSPREGQRMDGNVVLVEGRLEIHAETLRIVLEDDDQHVLDATTIDTANRDGGIRPLRAPTFRVELAIDSPNPQGRKWIVITAYDEGGRELASTRQSVWFGRGGSAVPAPALFPPR